MLAYPAGRPGLESVSSPVCHKFSAGESCATHEESTVLKGKVSAGGGCTAQARMPSLCLGTGWGHSITAWINPGANRTNELPCVLPEFCTHPGICRQITSRSLKRNK